jgi:hypothetical protein
MGLDHARIDVWWSGRGRNWQLMLLLAAMIQESDRWLGASVRLLRVVREPGEAERAQRELDRALVGAKLTAETRVFGSDRPDQSFFEVMRRESSEADLVVLGFTEPARDEGEVFVQRINESVRGLGTVLLVRASARFEDTKAISDQEA